MTTLPIHVLPSHFSALPPPCSETRRSFSCSLSQQRFPCHSLHRRAFLPIGFRHGDPSSGPGHRIRVEASAVREPMVPPYNVLITGSTKGIGFALAKEFGRAGDNLIVCSRSAERVESAIQSLRQEFGERRAWGIKCDVGIGKDVKDLVVYSQENLKYIDIWINNAGSIAIACKPLAEVSDDDIIEIVTRNMVGSMICCREAIKMMVKQPRGGHIFNIDAAGSDGRPTPRSAVYGATKRSVAHLTKSLQSELQMQDVKHVVLHNLSHGKVTADLLTPTANTQQARFFNVGLAEPAEVVAKYLVPKIRCVPAHGGFIGTLKAYSKRFSVK